MATPEQFPAVAVPSLEAVPVCQPRASGQEVLCSPGQELCSDFEEEEEAEDEEDDDGEQWMKLEP
jgi:hypothetical protein